MNVDAGLGRRAAAAAEEGGGAGGCAAGWSAAVGAGGRGVVGRVRVRSEGEGDDGYGVVGRLGTALRRNGEGDGKPGRTNGSGDASCCRSSRCCCGYDPDGLPSADDDLPFPLPSERPARAKSELLRRDLGVPGRDEGEAMAGGGGGPDGGEWGVPTKDEAAVREDEADDDESWRSGVCGLRGDGAAGGRVVGVDDMVLERGEGCGTGRQTIRQLAGREVSQGGLARA